MFPWCRTVNVYNVENHYHFYADNCAIRHPSHNAVFAKLKAAPISVTRVNSLARNSKSKTKKGLNLYKNLDSILNPQGNEQQINTPRHKNNQFPNNNNHVQHGRSATWYEIEANKTKGCEREGLQMQRIKPSSISTQTQTVLNFQYEPSVSHQIQYKPKPAIRNSRQLIIPIQLLKQQNNLLLTNLYSTQSNSNYLAKTSPNIMQNTDSLQPDVSPVSNKSDVMELTTSRNLCSREKSQSSIGQVEQQNMSISNSDTHSRYQESTSGYGYNNSKYNASKSLSASAIAGTHNQGFYFRIMEQSRGEARQASIMLSNILSRASENCYSSMHLTPNRNRLPADKRMLFEDKQTILSHENDMSSDSQIKVQQSEINDMDPRNNFIIISDQTIESNGYTVSLAIENLMKCLVSLKQVSFREMSDISQELQMYQFIEHLTHTDGYHNVLQLYQVQMAGSSYILIKEPYTCSLISFLSKLSDDRVTVLSEFHQILTDLLQEFANHMLYPWRLLTLKDFVVCGGCIIKLHDLSVFRAMKQPIFEVAFLIQRLNVEEMKVMNIQ